jgi:acetyl esterase/lipase
MHAPFRMTLLPLLLASALSAQMVRYRDPVFPQLDLQSDLAYGAAVNRWTGQSETLLLDLYEPAGDTAALRPAIVVVHGGGFVAGDKAGANYAQLAIEYAKRGYVAVSINYRLAPFYALAQDLPAVIADASEDYKAAVRYLRAMAGPLRVDPDRIAGLGGSSGAMTVLAGAYIAGEGQSGNPGFPSEVAAVVSLWGSLLDVSVMDAGEAPVCLFHGTNDPIVPYARSVAIHDRAQLVGIPSELHPMVGESHAPYATFFADFIDEAAAFTWRHLRLGELNGLTLQPGWGSPGAVTLQGTGLAGELRWLGISLGLQSVMVPDLGELCLDVSSLVLLALPAFDAVPALPTASVTFQVPAGLGGTTYHVQEVRGDATGRLRLLTNCLTIAF